MTLTFTITSPLSRNDRRALHRAAARINYRDSADRCPVWVEVRRDAISLNVEENDAAYRNPDVSERKACIREAHRTMRDMMLISKRTFNYTD